MQTPVALALVALLAACAADADDRERAAHIRAAEAAEAPAFPPEAADTVATVARRLLADPQVDWLISPSPDGREIARTEWWRGDLAVRDLASGEERRLTEQQEPYSEGFAMFPRYSPDGRTIAYAWWNTDRPWEWDLRLIAAEGGEARTLVGGTEYVQAEAWSPDGRRIAALISQEDGTNDIVVVSVEDGSVRLLKSLDWRYPTRMDFSPDGEWIAYDFPPVEDKPERDIFVLAADGSSETAVVRSRTNDQLLGWAPDGSLLFLSEREGTPGAWLLPMKDGRPAGEAALVKPDMWRAAPVGFTADGAYFYGVQTGTRGVHTVGLDVEGARVSGTPSAAAEGGLGNEMAPRWSPDGRYLAYMVTPTSPAIGAARNRFLAVRSLETGEVRQLRTPAEMVYPVGQMWTSDGTLLVTGRDRGNLWVLYSVDPLTNRSERLLRLSRDEGGLYRFTVTPDGRTLVYSASLRTEDPMGEHVLTVRDLVTGETRPILRMDGARQRQYRHLAASPDGASVALVEWGGFEARLLLVDLQTGEERELSHLTGRTLVGTAWTPDGRHLLIVIQEFRDEPPEAGSDPPRSLALVDVETGELRELGLELEALQQVDVHPDGRRVAFVSGNQSTEIWALENFLAGFGGERANR